MICPPGQGMHPASGCDCVPLEEIRALYPAWATDADISQSNVEGMSTIFPPPIPEPTPVVKPDYWPACNTFAPCEEGSWLNELACSCMQSYECNQVCPKNQVMDPFEGGCSCIEEEALMGKFPEWASMKDVDYSLMLNGKMGVFKPQHPGKWPQCNPIPMCAPGHYFNNLTCACWPEYSLEPCAIRCSSFIDPRTQCGCLKPDDFYSLFPRWATK
mmetsp:Transcript_18636/g.25132  ORF Transcript_18636/g.25132 Transcript_18636/m.25132 type:complete len:215 (-) Transcript_18636:649-1293(-)